MCVICVYHGDIRALLRGFNCDIRGPGALFIPNTVDDTQQAQVRSRPLIGANDIVGSGGPPIFLARQKAEDQGFPTSQKIGVPPLPTVVSSAVLTGHPPEML